MPPPDKRQVPAFDRPVSTPMSTPTFAGNRVLIVEDDMMVAFMIEDFFQDLACHIVGVEMRLEQALEAARQNDIDFALLDINLNGEESFPVADILRDRGVPFVFATGYSAAIIPERFNGAGVLAKPFDATNLQAMLAHVFDKGGEAAN